MAIKPAQKAQPIQAQARQALQQTQPQQGNFGTYNQGGIQSIGGRTPSIGGNYAGGTLGLDHGQLFGNANINGQNIGSFGPQGGETPPSHVIPYLVQLAQTMHPAVLGTLLYRALHQHGGGFGAFNSGGVQSIGGSTGGYKGGLGGSVGLDHGVPFGNANFQGKQIGSFGPQEDY